MNDSCSLFFHAVSDGTRQRILELLLDGEMCVSDIGRHFDTAQPTISHHLDILKRAGLVTNRKQGREVYYSLNSSCVCDCCGPFFSKLGFRLEKETSPK
jgi:DNA-binding transcriptional ArsR family regulator